MQVAMLSAADVDKTKQIQGQSKQLETQANDMQALRIDNARKNRSIQEAIEHLKSGSHTDAAKLQHIAALLKQDQAYAAEVTPVSASHLNPIRHVVHRAIGQAFHAPKSQWRRAGHGYVCIGTECETTNNLPILGDDTPVCPFNMTKFNESDTTYNLAYCESRKSACTDSSSTHHLSAIKQCPRTCLLQNNPQWKVRQSALSSAVN